MPDYHYPGDEDETPPRNWWTRLCLRAPWWPFVVLALLDQLFQLPVEAARLQQIGDDDRVRRGARRAEGPVFAHEVRIDRIEPELGAAGDKLFQGGRHDVAPYSDNGVAFFLQPTGAERACRE